MIVSSLQEVIDKWEQDSSRHIPTYQPLKQTHDFVSSQKGRSIIAGAWSPELSALLLRYRFETDKWITTPHRPIITPEMRVHKKREKLFCDFLAPHFGATYQGGWESRTPKNHINWSKIYSIVFDLPLTLSRGSSEYNTYLKNLDKSYLKDFSDPSKIALSLLLHTGVKVVISKDKYLDYNVLYSSELKDFGNEADVIYGVQTGSPPKYGLFGYGTVNGDNFQFYNHAVGGINNQYYSPLVPIVLVRNPEMTTSFELTHTLLHEYLHYVDISTLPMSRSLSSHFQYNSFDEYHEMLDYISETIAKQLHNGELKFNDTSFLDVFNT